MESGNRVETGRLAAEIEALLFASDAPISIGRLSAIIGEPSVKTINAPNKARKIIIGANHHFFRTFKKSQNSATIANLLIGSPSVSER